MAIVTKYKGHDVPSGATKFREDTGDFYKVLNGVTYYWRDVVWDEVDCHSVGWELAAELPQEPETFVPVVGEECEMLITEFEPVMPLFVGDQLVIVEICRAEIAYNLREMDFRAIKSEREKVIDAANSGISGVVDRPLLDSVIGQLYDAGMLVMPK